MPRYGPFIHQVYIADGFADDCDELIHRCLKAERFDYQVFCKIWKEMNIGCLYEGRTLGAEIAELSEEVIHIGKHYMLKDTSNFEESVIGVFIVYALLHLQPYKGFAHLRIIPEDLPAISRIEHVARRDKRYDVLYALGSILIKGPVHYHAAEREYGMDLAVRKYLEGFTSIDKLGVRPKGVFRRQNEELDILKELQTITQRYTQAKMLISDRAQFDRNLKYINPNLPNELETSLKKLISGIHEDQYGILGEGKTVDGDKISKSRKAIKEKAMKQEVKPVRHLVNSKYRKSSSASPTKEDSKTSPKKKSKSTNKNKMLAERQQRKRRIPISPRAFKKGRNSDLYLDDDEYISESEGSDVDVIESHKKGNSSNESIILSEKKEVNVNNAKKNKEKTTSVKDEEHNEQELDIEIETLPVLIRTEDQGKLFEIEIIDKKEPTKEPVTRVIKTYKRKESALKKISKLPGMSIQKITDKEIVEPVASTSSANDYARIIEIGERSSKHENKIGQDKQEIGISCSKIEKRDCKRVHLQSKFKRLGMLPIANFNSPEAMILNETDENSSSNEPEGNLELAPIED